MATIDGQFRVVRVEGQGCGYITPANWDNMPGWARGKIHVLRFCRTEEEAQAAQRDLPPEWNSMAIINHPVQLTQMLALEEDPQIDKCVAALGVAEDGAPLYVRLPSSTVGNLLVVGGSGCGKTTLLHSIVLSLAALNASNRLVFVLVGDGLRWFDTLPHPTCMVKPTDASSAFAGLVAQVKQYAPLQPRLVVVVDDLEGLGGMCSGLAELASHRGDGIHVIVAARSIGAATELIASQHFPVCLAGRGADGLVVPGYNVAKIAGLQRPGEFVAFAEGRAMPFFAAQSGPRDMQAMEFRPNE